jgi:hypothetical protein
MNTENQIGERDRDRALIKLRWLTAASGIASLAAAALGTSAAAQASTPAVHPSAGGSAKANPAAGSLSVEQLAALNFALPKPGTIVIWAMPGQPTAAGRAPAAAPAPGAGPAPAPAAGPAPAPAPAPPPRPAPPPPPPPVATTGTS